ncbi:MAG TPA: lipoprotein-releasing ABC transporter ATP-binding protein LolD [Gammaproteobacteria bacterium]|nr:lipoprotein-releasing ABC transporter ATP-binding protein LolD [Gammaproteobacteria bacterium]
MSNMIKCQDLDYSYHDGKVKTSVLSSLNLNIGKGESIAILGQSGCGKSTLLNLLGGIDKPTQGKVWLNNIDLTTLTEEKTTQLRAQHLGFVYQFHHLLKDFSALDNVAMPLLIRGDNKQAALLAASELLSTIGLKDRLDHRPAELSGGERQRVAIARALITKPNCLLADEPTGNLDAKNAADVLSLMIELNQAQNSALVMVTHDEKIAQKMQRILVLENGQLSES